MFPLSTSRRWVPIYGIAMVSSLIILVPLHAGVRNVGLDFYFRCPDVVDRIYRSHCIEHLHWIRYRCP